VEALVGRCEDGVNWSFIRLAQSSVASLSVVPFQDVLGLGSEARLNIPSKHEGNYHWRMQPGSLTRELAEKLARLAEVTDRLPQPIQVPTEQDFFALKPFLRVFSTLGGAKPRPHTKSISPKALSTVLLLHSLASTNLVWGRGYAPSSKIERIRIFLLKPREKKGSRKKKAGILRSRRGSWWLPG